MRPIRALAVILAMTALPAAVLAASLPLKSSYGNADGCLYAATGEFPGTDDLFLLTPDAVTTAVSYCEFKSVLTESAQGFVVSVACSEEGNQEEEAAFEINIEPAGPDAYTLRLDDGSTWGPLALCR
ncbi:hypothetical protein M8R20_09570 [Pseudomonas sp. R2.Fl]|nr:hypothetical protein [Pseudomonas sp. R2.Fl]